VGLPGAAATNGERAGSRGAAGGQPAGGGRTAGGQWVGRDSLIGNRQVVRVLWVGPVLRHRQQAGQNAQLLANAQLDIKYDFLLLFCNVYISYFIMDIVHVPYVARIFFRDFRSIFRPRHRRRRRRGLIAVDRNVHKY
jgi:hypothetical protein